MAGDIWIVSDTHFNHTNIIRYCNRPYPGVWEMNEALIENWNSVVKEQDKVYHLGDVYFSKHWKSKTGAEHDIPKDQRTIEADGLLSRLNGKKRLLLGNHDDGKDKLLLKHFQKIGVWRQFTEFGLLLTHVPVNPYCFDEGKTGEQRKYNCNVHGHVHQNSLRDKRYVNVSVEVTGYTPINIEELRTK